MVLGENNLKERVEEQNYISTPLDQTLPQEISQIDGELDVELSEEEKSLLAVETNTEEAIKYSFS